MTRKILSGRTPPTNRKGANGDYYIDTRVWLRYGPKAHGAWPPGEPIIPPETPPAPGGIADDLPLATASGAVLVEGDGDVLMGDLRLP